jgi:hypothetical protein
MNMSFDVTLAKTLSHFLTLKYKRINLMLNQKAAKLITKAKINVK